MDSDTKRDMDSDTKRDMDIDTKRYMDSDTKRDMDRDTRNDDLKKNADTRLLIMIVDDVTINRNIIESVFKSFFSKNSDVLVDIIHATNGLEAINLFTSQTIDMLICMDINMPVMDGVTATKHIRQMCPDTLKVYICCLSAEFFNDEHNIFNQIINKPIGVKALRSLVKKFQRFVKS